MYAEILRSLLEKGLLSKSSSILVGCAGAFDDSVFQEVGFTNVTLSNLAPDQDKLRAELHYPVAHLDVEAIDAKDKSYDWVVVHAGLHHCANPAAAVLEMFRVCRVGIMAVEPVDSSLTSLSMKFGLSQRYEVGSVVDKEGGQGGGLRFGGIPNLIYRFNPSVVRKIINTAYPEYVHQYIFWPRIVIPWKRLAQRNRFVAMVLPWFRSCVSLVEKSNVLANNLGFAVLKPDPETSELHPWLERRGDEIRIKESLLKKSKEPILGANS